MKTTIELPDAIFRQVKGHAAARGVTLKRFFIEALEEQFRRCASEPGTRKSETPWMGGFGVLSDLADENRRVLRVVEQEFETLAL
jgi:hypothetical protein